jgi:alkylated DNA repair dioxygenase AlkB
MILRREKGFVVSSAFLLFLLVLSGVRFDSGYTPVLFAAALSTVTPRATLVATLQQCNTPHEIVDRVGRHLTSQNDPDHSLNSLVWTRLCKQIVALDNQLHFTDGETDTSDQSAYTIFDENFELVSVLSSLTNLLRVDRQSSSSKTSVHSLIDATKAASVVHRIMNKNTKTKHQKTIWKQSIQEPLLDLWKHAHALDLSAYESNQISGLYWALDTLCSVVSENDSADVIPDFIEAAYDQLQLPFRIYPGHLQRKQQQQDTNNKIELNELLKQVDFNVDAIYTAEGVAVLERRQTAWQGDDGVAPFAYSGKSMSRQDWSPMIQHTRNQLSNSLGVYYDCCLINHYYDGSSAMRYHIDPDQGILWGYDTSVVSVGATRRFAFRHNENQTVHSFWVFNGDVTHMFGDCQETYQHTVKKAEWKQETASRASMVFKKTFQRVQ